MLNSYMPLLIKDLELGNANLQTSIPGVYHLPFGDEFTIVLSNIDNGFMLKCLMAPLPKTDQEALIEKVMQGNLFGKETQNAILGLTPDGDNLTLTHVVDYDIDYKGFKDILENFINTVDFWREQALGKIAK